MLNPHAAPSSPPKAEIGERMRAEEEERRRQQEEEEEEEARRRRRQEEEAARLCPCPTP